MSCAHWQHMCLACSQLSFDSTWGSHAASCATACMNAVVCVFSATNSAELETKPCKDMWQEHSVLHINYGSTPICHGRTEKLILSWGLSWLQFCSNLDLRVTVDGILAFQKLFAMQWTNMRTSFNRAGQTCHNCFLTGKQGSRSSQQHVFTTVTTVESQIHT